MRNILYFVPFVVLFASFSSSTEEIDFENSPSALQNKTYVMETKKELKQNLQDQAPKSNAEIGKTENKKQEEIFNEEDYESIISRLPNLKRTLSVEEEKINDEKPVIQETKNKTFEENHESTPPKLPDTVNVKEEKINDEKPVIQETANKTFEENHEPTPPKLPDTGNVKEEKINDEKPVIQEPVNEVYHEKLLRKDDALDQTKLPSESEPQKEPNGMSPEPNQAQEMTENLPEKQNSDFSSVADHNANDLQKAEQRREDELPVDKVPKNKEDVLEIRNEKKYVTRQEKPIVERTKEKEDKELQKRSELSKEPLKEWVHKKVQSKLIYKRQYDSLNEHLPTAVSVHDYSKQLFYCIKKSNLSCLRGVISKLEKIGVSIEKLLKFRNELGDTPLIYAAKWGEIDVVRFLLLQGANLNAVNYNFQSAMDIAITRKQINIINVITEMMPRLVEHRTINNKESEPIYDWAINTKQDNETKCNENY